MILPWIVLETVAADKPAPTALDFFEKKVRLVLVEHCYGCHSVASKKERGGLLLDSKEALLKGGDSGSALVPGKPDGSLLIKHVRWTGDRKMPAKEKLPDSVFADLEKWIGMGAPDPRTGNKVARSIDYTEGRKHWAYQPVKDAAWAKNDMDRYILSRIEAKGLRPAEDASREALLRRVTFDLTGLPPTPDEVEAARNNKQEAWYESVVDRLLKSKEYGVHRARHWLDGVRFNLVIETVDHYRDCVVRAFNDDVPYEQPPRCPARDHDRVQPSADAELWVVDHLWPRQREQEPARLRLSSGRNPSRIGLPPRREPGHAAQQQDAQPQTSRHDHGGPATRSTRSPQGEE